MNEEFLKRFAALVRLRYRLVWAHARSGNGRMALLFALYLLGGLFGVFFALGGVGAAAIAIEMGREESFARWILTALFINGVGLSLLFGIGPRSAFAEEALRRYPLTARERFFVRQSIGLLDPAWLLLTVTALGLTVGFVALGGSSLLTSLPAVLLFIVVNYLATMVLLSLLGRVLETRRGSAILGSVVLLLVSFGPLAISMLAATYRQTVWRGFDLLLRFTPPGATAGVMAGEDAIAVLGSAFWLLVWCVGLVWALRKLESLPRLEENTATGELVWQDWVEQASSCFRGSYRPLISKALRYHLRCNMIRFSLLTSPLIILLGQYFVPTRNQEGQFFVALAMFFVLSGATAAAMMLNAFGYDAAGIRRYAILPVSFADALRASNLASLILRALAVLAAFALWLAVYNRAEMNWRLLPLLFGTAVGSLLLYNAFGLWTSVYAPKVMDFDALWNQRLSVGANIVVIGGVLVPFWALLALASRFGQTVAQRFWWAALLFLAVSAAFYAFSFHVIERALRARRERLINQIAGAQSN